MSIRLRLTIYWTAITALILFAAGLLIMVMFARAMWGALDAALMEEADTTATTISHSTAADAGLILRRLSQEKDLGPGRRVRLVAGGHPVFDAGDTGADLPDALAAPKSVVDGGQHRYRFAVVPLRVNGESAFLQDGADAAPVRRAVAHLRSALLLVIPIILALCVAGGYWMSAWALIPVNQVTAALARIGPRDLRQRLPLTRVHDEAGQLIHAINQLLERLERASAAQRRFVSEAAHELRTPLAVLRSGLEVTLQRPRGAAESRVALEQAMGEVERLCTIAEDLLALARLEAEPAVERAPVDLSEIAAEASVMAQTLAEARHQVLASDARKGIVVQGSAGDLRRVVLNLLDNAVKFTPAGGRIEIGVSAQGPTALLSVCDNGPGIDPRDLEHIFDPFYRSRGANGAGSGLGLALSREIVRRHGGVIRAANRIAGGCEIQVRLPLAGG
ncbi:MAG TPA: HAMP domain-containing sensor histidine kinase [Candidatus Binataceae bacterium]|nr:HAMP domain-containing sensor histidine kinase [Candidatus Binataceae bacterium]